MNDEDIRTAQVLYEETSAILGDIAMRFDVSDTYIANLAKQYGWRRRSKRTKEQYCEDSLLNEAIKKKIDPQSEMPPNPFGSTSPQVTALERSVPLPPDVLLEAAGSEQAEIIMAHRRLLHRERTAIDQLVGETYKIGNIAQRVGLIEKLVNATSKVTAMEREAYDIRSAQPEADPEYDGLTEAEVHARLAALSGKLQRLLPAQAPTIEGGK